MIYLLIGYMWLFIHRPFEIWTWLAELRVERVYMAVTLFYWLTQPKTWVPCRSHLPVFLLAFTYLLGSQTSPYANWSTVEDWFKVFVFYLLLVSSIRTERELKIIIVAFVAIMALYELHSLREYFNGRGVYRMGTWRMVGVNQSFSDPNSFASTVNYGLPFLYPAWTLTRTRRQKAIVLAMLALAITCIVLTGSRASFAALAGLVALVAIGSKHRWRLLLVLLIAPPIIWNTLPSDLQNRYITLIDPEAGPENAKHSAETRTQSFQDGLRSFAANPVFGAGLGSYRAKTGMGSHNVYNEALGELGLFGLSTLVGFLWAFVRDWHESRAHVKLLNSRDGFAELDSLFLYRVALAGLLTCITLFTLGWASHNLGRFNWLWSGAFTGIAVQQLRLRLLASGIAPHDGDSGNVES